MISDIKVQRVIRTLDLADFQPEYKGMTMGVWVNPPLKVSRELGSLLFEWQAATAKWLLLKDPLKYQQNLSELTPEQIEKLKPGTPEEVEKAKTAEQKAKRAYYAWFAQVWEDSSGDEVWALVEKLEAEEPALLVFLKDRTLAMIQDYIEARKKA